MELAKRFFQIAFFILLCGCCGRGDQDDQMTIMTSCSGKWYPFRSTNK